MFPAVSAPSARPLAPPAAYCPIPQRLITGLHDNALAIGLYGLVARLYLVAQAPIPLSAPDVLRYDPTLSRGAVLRALARLVGGGWLIEAAQTGRKTSYTPTWGRVSGAPLAWDMARACLGRPPHVARLRVDRRLLDICIGKLVPHATRTAVITRYLTTPVLSLADVGSYALMLAGLERATPALLRIGAVQGGVACALPSDERLLALLSQRGLEAPAAGSSTLTISGARKLGVQPLLAPEQAAAAAQPIFFVPQELIGCMIQPMIASMIAPAEPKTMANSASGRAKTRSDIQAPGITWETRDQPDTAIPTPPAPQEGGGAAGPEYVAGAARRKPPPRALPETEAALALQEINVRPAQIAELAQLPPSTVAAAIADGRSRPGIRDLAGWVVSLLRAHRDYGWRIEPAAPLVAAPAAQSEPELPLEQPSSAPDLSLALPLVRIWNDAQAAMRTQLTRQEFQTWLRPAELQAIERGTATIWVSDARAKERLEQCYLLRLRELLSGLAGEQLRVRVIAGAEELAGPAEPASAAAAGPVLPADAERPPWISTGDWSSLPALLRAALIGSTLADGAVQALSPHLNRLLATRYAREVAVLLARSIDGRYAGTSSTVEPCSAE